MIYLHTDKGFYMLISTFYILAGLAFTSTIIEIIRQVSKPEEDNNKLCDKYIKSGSVLRKITSVSMFPLESP